MKRGTGELEEVEDYTLTGSNGSKVRLSDLFEKKDNLILVHNMGRSCPYCTMWADGFNGVLDHMEDRAAFAVCSPDASSAQRKFASGRGWKFKMVSSKGSSFSKDMGFENKDGGAEPGVSVFHKNTDGRIFRVSKDEFGPGDEYCIVWHFFDLLPGGSKGWEPRFRYR